jgi:hypothetical protein
MSQSSSDSFTILSQSSIQAVIQYYTDELPKQGWASRYSDPNFTGGVIQYWKRDNIYLSLDFGFIDGQLTIQGQYKDVEPQEAQKLPKDFPLPGQAEMVDAGDTSWEFYIPEPYTDVTSFYNQKLASLNWKSAPGMGAGGLGGCGSDCGSVQASYPPGTTPMPTATTDYRNSNELSFTMPDGNEIDLTITPHQNATLLDVEETLKNVESAGLPKDVPIYPGAVVQMVAPGTVEFQVNADMKTIENYYSEQLKAAGWAPENPFETSGSYNQEWSKGDQKISIALVASGQTTNLVIDCESCNP